MSPGDGGPPPGAAPLAGSVAVVSGASGGIGSAIAVALAQAGADVVGMARRMDRLERTAERVGAAGREFVGVRADLSDVGSLADASREAWEWKDGVDSVVNAAGTLVRGDLLEVSPADWDETFGVNVRGTFFLTQAFAGRMLARGSGSIVNVTSVAGQVTTRAPAPYSASKAALIQLTRVLAVRLAPAVRVNAVGPAYVRTELNAGWLDAEENLGWVRERTPLGRVGTPGDVAGAVVFLVSRAASYVTGQHLLVDGGWTAQ